jgi:hypothetical protein
MTTYVAKDTFKTTNMKFSDLDNKFFDYKDAADGKRQIKFSKFIKKYKRSQDDRQDDVISNGEVFDFQDALQPAEFVTWPTGGRLRLEKQRQYGPLNATENANISTDLRNISMSHYKGSITYYKVIQTGTDDHNTHPDGYVIEDQDWNGNLDKLIPKQFELQGVMGQNNEDKYACIFEGRATNMQMVITGGVFGAGSKSSLKAGGSAMYVAGQGDLVPILMEGQGKIWSGGGWGGKGGRGGQGGRGGGSNISPGGDGGSRGLGGSGGRGQGYDGGAQGGGSGGVGGSGGAAGPVHTWYKADFADPELRFTGTTSGDSNNRLLQVETYNASEGYSYVKFSVTTDDDYDKYGRSWTSLAGDFGPFSGTIVNAPDDGDGTVESEALLITGYDGGTTGYINLTGNSGGVSFSADKSQCYAYDEDGTDNNAIITIVQLQMDVKHKGDETFQGGAGGDGGDGGDGGKGGAYGKQGGDGKPGFDGEAGDNSTTSHNSAPRGGKKNPKYLFNSSIDYQDVTLTATTDAAYNGVIHIPGFKSFGSSTIGDDNNDSYTAQSIRLAPRTYYGPISHWSEPPWGDAQGTIDNRFGAYTIVGPGGTSLQLDDAGSIGIPHDDDYNDVIVTISGGNGVKFVNYENVAATNAEIAGTPGEGKLAPGKGTRGGLALSGTNYTLHNNTPDPADSYRSDDSPPHKGNRTT